MNHCSVQSVESVVTLALFLVVFKIILHWQSKILEKFQRFKQPEKNKVTLVLY